MDAPVTFLGGMKASLKNVGKESHYPGLRFAEVRGIRRMLMVLIVSSVQRFLFSIQAQVYKSMSKDSANFG